MVRWGRWRRREGERLLPAAMMRYGAGDSRCVKECARRHRRKADFGSRLILKLTKQRIIIINK